MGSPRWPKTAEDGAVEWKDEKTLNVYEAVDSRRSVRAFGTEPVSKEVLERVLTAAARAPSSGNLQPWKLYVVAGEPLAELKRRATAGRGRRPAANVVASVEVMPDPVDEAEGCQPLRRWLPES